MNHKTLVADIHEIKAEFPSYLREVAAGCEVIVLTAAKPVAKIVPYAPARTRKPGLLKGRIAIGSDFDLRREGFDIIG